MCPEGRIGYNRGLAPSTEEAMSANERQEGGDHYKKQMVTGENLEHWDICWQLGFDQFQYCITKYVFRHKHKNGLEDLLKARHHLDKYIELLANQERIDGLNPLDPRGLGFRAPRAHFDTGEPQGKGYVDQG